MSTASELPETLMDHAKLQIADYARLMTDNQRTLDRSNQMDQRLRDLDYSIAEANAERAMGVKLRPPQETKEDDTRILIDSPTTITHHYQQPATQQSPAQPQQPQPSTLSKLAPWALAAGIGLGGAGLGAYLNRPTPPPAAPPAVVPSEPADPVEMPRYDVEKWTPK